MPSSELVAPNGSVLGRTEPRLWTPPLRELTPETSYGFDVVDFARNTLHHPLDPWQNGLAIHAGEMLPDGRPRFRIVLVLVARQNGKTELLVVLSLFWQFVEAWPLILGTSTKLDYAKESWTKSTRLAEKTPALAALRPARWKREANGEQESWTVEQSRYKIAASNEEGGRSLTIDRLIFDELRQHHNYSAWDAAEPACSPYGTQIWALSNMGDDRSVVLNDLRDSAVEFIEWWDRESGQRGVAELLAAPDLVGDPRVGLFEWSSPPGSDPLDLSALAMANPNLGRRKDPDALLGAARRAVAKGGQALTGFQTEQMCLRVKSLNPAYDPATWEAGRVPGTLDELRDRVVLVFDVSPDLHHATLTAAATGPDGRTRVEPVAAWTAGAKQHGMGVMVRELKAHVAKIAPARFGWLPGGPAAAYGAELRAKDRDGKATRPRWLPPKTRMEEIRSELPDICMGLDEQLRAGAVLHSGDALQDAHVLGAQKLELGNGRWVISRRDGGHCDAAYSAAGAVHLARTMPAPVGKPRLVVVE